MPGQKEKGDKALVKKDTSSSALTFSEEKRVLTKCLFKLWGRCSKKCSKKKG